MSEVARTTSWSAFVGNIEKPADALDAYIGVRGVSVDGKTVTEPLWQHLDMSPNGSGSTTADPTEYPTITNSPASADRYVSQVVAKAKTNLSQSWASNPALDTHDAGLFEQPWGFGMGDLNDDEIISIYDITALVSILRNNPAATIRCKGAADVNMDGIVDLRDVEAAVRSMFGVTK